MVTSAVIAPHHSRRTWGPKSPFAFQSASLTDNVNPGHNCPTSGAPNTCSNLKLAPVPLETATTSGFNLFRVKDSFENKATDFFLLQYKQVP